MSGHSKWHNIRLRKGKQDAVRSNLFTKLAKEIIVAAKGGGNPDLNMHLRMAVDKARSNSMPADNIKRAIQRGTGEIAGVSYDEITYEGYGPNGVAMMVECLTDNKQRTVAEVRSIFSKNGGRLAESGSVGYLFTPTGIILTNPGATTEDALMEVALEAGADDVQPTDEGGFEITTAFEDFGTVRNAIEAAKIPIASADTTMVPSTTVALEGKDAAQILRMVDLFEDNDDVRNVYANFDISDEEMDSL